jgi:hypothetical protein
MPLGLGNGVSIPRRPARTRTQAQSTRLTTMASAAVITYAISIAKKDRNTFPVPGSLDWPPFFVRLGIPAEAPRPACRQTCGCMNFEPQPHFFQLWSFDTPPAKSNWVDDEPLDAELRQEPMAPMHLG